jgi:hypothetical protein
MEGEELGFAQEELKNLDIRYSNVNLGEVEVSEKIAASQIEALRLNLKKISY